ncbi:MAG: Asp-tRNA(Asn)/Glu-tRNA(Gln) amidotransferase subunit GatC [Endomicrobiia bacterium]|nr:Asp-tRNA(Asn)/Glu-tRNA(Gln) amidotransferase subunit GatC [Endomicrobiia bacterium]
MDKKITPREIRHIAHLARLRLTDDEVELFSSQLDGILGYVGHLGELDLKNVRNLSVGPSSPSGGENMLRRDEAAPSPSRGALLDNAPSRSGDYFKVKKVIE